MNKIEKTQWKMIIGGSSNDQPIHVNSNRTQSLPDLTIKFPEDFNPRTPIDGNILLSTRQ